MLFDSSTIPSTIIHSTSPTSVFITAPLEDIKTVYQQRHNLPSTYAMASQLKGLHQIKLVKNEKYQKAGLKSFGHLVRKCDAVIPSKLLRHELTFCRRDHADHALPVHRRSRAHCRGRSVSQEVPAKDTQVQQQHCDANGAKQENKLQSRH